MKSIVLWIGATAIFIAGAFFILAFAAAMQQNDILTDANANLKIENESLRQEIEIRKFIQGVDLCDQE